MEMSRSKTSRLLDDGTSWVALGADYQLAQRGDSEQQVSTEFRISISGRASTTKREGTVSVRTVPRPPTNDKSSDTK